MIDKEAVKRLLIIGSLLLVCGFAAISYAADAWQEPEDFRGLKWGASPSEMYTIFPAAPVKPSLSYGERIKLFFVSNEKIGEVRTFFSIGFLDDGFAYVDISFKESDFTMIDQAFETRYGTPHAVRDVPVQTRAGAKFTNIVKTWNGPSLNIRLERYSNKITDGHAVIAKRAYVDEFMRIRKEKRKDAAKGL